VPFFVLEIILVRVVSLLLSSRLFAPICEYSNVVFMGASATHLHKLNSVQKFAEKLCGTTFSSLSSCRNASSIGLLCNLQDRDPLQSFCLALASIKYPYSFRHVNPLLSQFNMNA